jgi:hypothetical protein
MMEDRFAIRGRRQGVTSPVAPRPLRRQDIGRPPVGVPAGQAEGESADYLRGRERADQRRVRAVTEGQAAPQSRRASFLRSRINSSAKLRFGLTDLRTIACTSRIADASGWIFELPLRGIVTHIIFDIMVRIPAAIRLPVAPSTMV